MLRMVSFLALIVIAWTCCNDVGDNDDDDDDNGEDDDRDKLQTTKITMFLRR